MKTNSVTEKTFGREQIIRIVIAAIAIALTYVFTAFVNITLPIAINGGLIHLGNVPLFLFAILFGKKVGALAGETFTTFSFKLSPSLVPISTPTI